MLYFFPSFYVIVRGAVSVYAKNLETEGLPEIVAKDVTTARGLQERSKFGVELCQLGKTYFIGFLF